MAMVLRIAALLPRHRMGVVEAHRPLADWNQPITGTLGAVFQPARKKGECSSPDWPTIAGMYITKFARLWGLVKQI
jgi:hypothetical protein